MFEAVGTRKAPRPATAASMLFHVAMLPFLFWVASTPPVRQIAARQLNVELMGVNAKRQQAAIHRAAPASAPASRPASDQPQPEPIELKAAVSEAHSESALSLPSQSAPAPAESQRGGAPGHAGNGEIEQRALSASRPVSEIDLINGYISSLAHLVNTHLIYPAELKKRRVEGIAWVSFRVDEAGNLEPGSLQIKRSSGSPVLDGNAMRTIQSLAPFAHPPRAMTVSLGIEFAVDR